MDILIAVAGTYLISQYFFKMRYKRDNYEIFRILSSLVKEMDVMSEKLGETDFADYLYYTKGSVYKTEFLTKLEKIMSSLSK